MGFDFSFLGCGATDDATVEAWEKEERKFEIKNNLSHYMPYGSENETFETYNIVSDNDKVMLKAGKDFAEACVDHQFGALVLCGDVGIGKTHLAYACMRYVMEHGENTRINKYTENGIVKEERFTYPMIAKYTTIPHLCDRYNAAMAFDSKESQVDVIKDICSCNLIVLDEVSRGNRNESKIIFQIINEAWVKKIPVILTSNLTFKDFKEAIEKASWDRIRSCATIPCTDDIESHR